MSEFDKNVFGDCFAGGTFCDNEKQSMYTSGYKEGFNKAKGLSKQFILSSLSSLLDEVESNINNLKFETNAISRDKQLMEFGISDLKHAILVVLSDLRKEIN